MFISIFLSKFLIKPELGFLFSKSKDLILKIKTSYSQNQKILLSKSKHLILKIKRSYSQNQKI